MVPIFIVMINSLYVKDKDEYGKFSNIYTGLLYIAVPIALSNLIAFDKAGNFSGNLLLCFFIIIWCSDVGAFAFGISLGKIFPQNSFRPCRQRRLGSDSLADLSVRFWRRSLFMSSEY